MNRRCVVAEADFDDDIAWPLKWPGRSVVVEILASESGPDGRWVDIDVALLRRYLEAPIPVFYLTDMIDWEEGCLDPLGLGPPPYLDDVMGLWSAHSMAARLEGEQERGFIRVNLSDVSALGWVEFLRAFTNQSASEAPPGRLGSVTPLSPSLLSGPELPRKIVDQHGRDRLVAPPPCLYEYVPTEEGYVECTTDLAADVRRFAAEVEADRVDGGDGLMVLTMPWEVQLVPKDNVPFRETLRCLLVMPPAYADSSGTEDIELPDDFP